VEISSRIIKGGALLDESRRFVETWDNTISPGNNLDVFRNGNLLGKRSRARTEDTLAVLRQRFVEPGPQVIRSLRPLTVRADAFRDACYYEAARNDALLAHVAGSVLADLRGRGWTKVTVNDVERALLAAPPDPVVKAWGDRTRTRAVHGVLSALRDFGVLEGHANKHIAAPRISFAGFAYVLGRLREQLSSSYEIISSPVWQRWLLEDRQVRGLLLEADREGLLRFADAGSTVRIDWRVDGLEELVHAVV
jgi:Putative inner membrane protein (DUF1819)